jgi:hypothetical protein
MNAPKRPKASRLAEARRTSAVLALIAEPTIEGAAQASGVSRSTLYAWMGDAAFADELTRARTRAFDGGLDTIKGGTAAAASVLRALLESRSETTRRRAAETIINFALKIYEGRDLEARLKRLEEISEGQARPGTTR